eukprot:TRINITY_DN27468_c0_g1_i1.p1 TRINITY_DN27468_c0_g1~~TRINITY_DN27468_c0_g1_i1.p1  ORF type:complete len:484 (-),score=145.92 TRINITY_DN27468_c0_g1_i1:217-1647(-)
MGAAASQEASTETAAPESSAEPTAEEEEAYARVFRGDVDAKSTFKQAFADNVQLLEGVENLVRELEGQRGDKKEVSAERQKLEEAAKIQEEKERRAQKITTKAATAQADDWLEQQMRQGRAAEAAARAAKEKTASELRSRQDAAAQREQAIAEARAREELFEKAAAMAKPGSAIEAQQLLANAVLGEFAQGLRATEQPGVSLEDDLPPIPAAKVDVPTPEFYVLLGVTADATFEEIKAGYRKQALIWHPDKNRHRPDVATQRFQKINEAFDTLFDPKRRESYDSGQLKGPSKAKKLTGAGWASVPDEDDLALTADGLRFKKQSWRTYVLMYGRIDDDPDQFVDDDRDPRAPQMKINIFWRFMGEQAHLAQEEASSQAWLKDFIVKVWKDTPSRWPKALELSQMNEVSQQEWKERRMVYNRRKQKLQIAIDMHERYLAIPNREELERQRLQKKMDDAAISSVPKWNMGGGSWKLDKM